MRILQTIILSSLLLLIASNAYPQKDKSLQNVFIPVGYALDRNQVQYNQPKDFISYIDSLGKNKVYLGCFLAKESKRLPSYYRKSFLSKDSNFIILTAIPSIFCRRNDSVYADFDLLPEMKVEMNTYHLTHIKADFLKNTGKRVAFLSELPITYKSSKYARESFNADTVITYPLKMWEKYENKYTHCLVILIQKRYRGCIPLYCLYTDEGAKKLNHYIKSLQKVFWYRNPKDYIEVIDPVPETDNIFILPKRNESDTVRIVGQL